VIDENLGFTPRPIDLEVRQAHATYRTFYLEVQGESGIWQMTNEK
jgi:hypothetical protein